jgi:hypothetical protein
MMAVVVKVILFTIAAGSVSIALDRDTVTAINTLLNFASWYLLIMQQRKLRREVTPKLDHVENTIDRVLETRQEGGRRKHDPPTNGEHEE